jgi:ABC-type proline/glycine betaine transport system substrate-binding protein
LFLALTVGLALAVALSMTLAGDAEAKKKKNKPKPVDLSSTVAQSGFDSALNVAGDTAPINNSATPYTYTKKKKFVSLTQVKITLTCDDCDTGAAETDENNLSLGLDSIDTGVKLNGFRDNQVDTLTISGTPNNAPAIVAALQDHQVNATVIKTGGGTNNLVLPATFNTTLKLIGTAKKDKKKKKNNRR